MILLLWFMLILEFVVVGIVYVYDSVVGLVDVG